MSTAASMLVALVVDAGLGWPAALHARIGHPVTWLGALIAALDRSFNRETASDRIRRAAGIATAVLVIGAAAVTGWVATVLANLLVPAGWPSVVVTGVLAWPLIAARSMYTHVAAVARPLGTGDLEAARRAVAMIVGREPSLLDDAGVARAAIESLAENTSDGIVAPLFWGLVAGLPGIAAYKAINTLDSMIGHRTPRHEAFGWASARIDDVANLVPARLTGLLFAAVSAHPGAALATMVRDARKHRSPNAGWPEAAMAGALAIRLSGPRAYAGRIADEPWLNAAAPDPAPRTVATALALYVRALFVLGAGMAMLAVLPVVFG